MKIVIAPDSFKESMTALEAADAIERGWKQVLPDGEFIKVPMADGGEGTVQSLVDATSGSIRTRSVTGPLGSPVDAFYGILGDGKTAVIEMAAASGLHLVSADQRNPLITTTKGTGELILAAVEEGAENIIIGIGGSATNDGGAGMAQALGAKLLDEKDDELQPGGGALEYLERIDISQVDARLQNVSFMIACDVNNPLTGEKGASAVFGPQKGATPEMVQTLDRNLGHYAGIIQRDLGKDIEATPGAGAAGGLGAGLLAFLSAELRPGIEIVIEASGLEAKVSGADLIITGEGKIDSQTIYGKTPIGVAAVAKRSGIPVIALAGFAGPDADVVFDHGIDALFTIVPGPVSLAEAFENAEINTERVSRNIAKVWAR
ncbi:glycerate kinase [Bacillus marinisedimentorum]|uniref:glycerate kinase n=1 Tax=Bacillus marinisedimentorum TaxID=1821260 RepID=UPI000872E2B4|nr:glycerate kinase [Bacillus marinisedimentorum]